MSEDKYKPDVIHRTAKNLHTNKPIVTEATEDGFVLQHTFNRKGCTFVGLREEGDTFVVAKMWKKSEITGRNEPRIQTSENEYVQCELYRMDVVEPTNSDETVEAIADTIDNKNYEEKIDTGYINGYRLTALKDVLEDTFRWYGQ